MRKRKKQLRAYEDVFRHEHPDTRTGPEWVRQMIAKGWNWDKGTTGQSEWQRLNKNK